ncbi:restriction endonuclease subunit S [Sorangium sp. So ce315]|uniref:restriction endonuclease subunit S n=1 Tax=Sorangium sp. So ce315 TaxID=3133299 RepID=UPI003F602825
MSVLLKEILADSRDGEWGKGEAGDDTVEMVVIRGTDFERVRVGDVGDLPRRHVAPRTAERKGLRPADILIETAGGSKDRPTGRTLLLRQSLLQSLSLPVTCASFARFLRVDPSRAEPAYVFWLLQHLYNRGALRKYHTQHTGVARFQYTAFAEGEPLDLPERSVQRRIGDILSAYDDLIENNTKRIKILEETARSLYREWFVRFRFPGHEKVNLVASPPGKVPAGWAIRTVAETFEITGGGTPSKAVAAYWHDGDIPWFTPSDLTAAGTMFVEESGARITALGLSKSSARLFPARSVMMTSRATIGAIAVNTTPASTNQGFITCIPSEAFPLWVLFYWLKENVPQFLRLAGGATFKEITRGTFKQIELLVPPRGLVDAYERTAGPIAEQVLRLQRKNAALRATRDLLLPRLISGEIAAGELARSGRARSKSNCVANASG